MTYAKLKELVPEAFRRYSGVKPETFEAMLAVLEQVEADKRKAGPAEQAQLGRSTALDA